MGWLSRLRRAIQVFWTLPPDDKSLVIETCAESARVMIVLRTPWWRRLLRQPGSDGIQATVEEARIGEIAALANRTMSSPPFQMSCLERSIALQKLLRRRGVYADLVFGVRQEKNDRIAAHAWLDHPALPEDAQSKDFQRLETPIKLAR